MGTCQRLIDAKGPLLPIVLCHRLRHRAIWYPAGRCAGREAEESVRCSGGRNQSSTAQFRLVLSISQSLLLALLGLLLDRVSSSHSGLTPGATWTRRNSDTRRAPCQKFEFRHPNVQTRSRNFYGKGPFFAGTPGESSNLKCCPHSIEPRAMHGLSSTLELVEESRARHIIERASSGSRIVSSGSRTCEL